MIRIGNKYNYFRRICKGDGDSKQRAAYEMSNMSHISDFISVNFEGMKFWNKRVEKYKLDIGKIVLIERWDGNGISDEEIITKIQKDNTNNRIIVFTKNGHFHFNKENCEKDNIDFAWTCKGKSWEKKSMKWVDGKRYYYIGES